jgi:hypothetical protein
VKAGLVAAWLAGTGLVTWRIVHRDHRMPVPGALLGVSALFGVMALTVDVFPRTAGLVTLTAVGLDVAAFFNALPAGLSGQITQAQQSTAAAEGVSGG